MRYCDHFFQENFSAQPIVLSRKKFIFGHVAIPLLSLGLLFVGFEGSGLDFWLSTHFYDIASQQWPYKDNWVIQKCLHKGGRLVFFALVASILGAFLASFQKSSALKNYRLSLIFLFLASVSGPLLIMFLKNHTHIYCPWDLQLFGSVKPYIRWFDVVPHNMPVGHCFPAAHAGSGYTFVSLYFFFWATQTRYKFYGLAFGLGLGLLYGITQQMRGAHFLSHDVAALAICWAMACLMFLLFFRHRLVWR